MPRKKIKPIFEDPKPEASKAAGEGSITLSILASNVEAIGTWCASTSHVIEHLRDVAQECQAANEEISASLDAVINVLINTNITSVEEVEKLREEYLDRLAQYKASFNEFVKDNE